VDIVGEIIPRPIKDEEHFDNTVESRIADFIEKEEEKHVLFIGGQKDGAPTMSAWFFSIESYLDDEEELKVKEWLDALEEAISAVGLMPTYLCLTVPVSISRWNGDMETADFYANFKHTWITHSVELISCEEDITEEQGDYAYERFTDPQNDGPLELMSSTLIEFVMRKG
jgi:hypothetical protein